MHIDIPQTLRVYLLFQVGKSLFNFLPAEASENGSEFVNGNFP